MESSPWKCWENVTTDSKSHYEELIIITDQVWGLGSFRTEAERRSGGWEDFFWFLMGSRTSFRTSSLCLWGDKHVPDLYTVFFPGGRVVPFYTDVSLDIILFI